MCCLDCELSGYSTVCLLVNILHFGPGWGSGRSGTQTCSQPAWSQAGERAGVVVHFSRTLGSGECEHKPLAEELLAWQPRRFEAMRGYQFGQLLVLVDPDSWITGTSPERFLELHAALRACCRYAVAVLSDPVEIDRASIAPSTETVWTPTATPSDGGVSCADSDSS